MCAIAGVLKLEIGDETIERMLKSMARRGPDERGVFRYNDCCLLHARLTVIDPDGGHQPMTLDWNAERYTLIYNGELYNTDEIRSMLIKCGHRFEGHSDTEVLLHAFAQWKEACLSLLNGIFAFAVWEQNKSSLFLARDRMGVKPLFYKLHDQGLIFASEIKTILAYPTVRAELDAEGVAEILLLGPGRTPGCGVFRGISELEPGCCGYYINNHFAVKSYWKLTDHEHTESFEQTAEHVRSLLLDAIKRQMVSDVPVGAFLSGGLDSSLISSVCTQEMRTRGETLPTFSVDYKDNDIYFVPSKFQPNSDSHYIRSMQDFLQSDHHLTVLTPGDLTQALEDATIARDLPGMADVDFSLLQFCCKIRGCVKVALSGECADEIFGGYPWYRDPEIRALDGFPWSQNLHQRTTLMHPAHAGKIDADQYVKDRYYNTIAQSDILKNNAPQERRMKEMVNLNHRWFMQTLLDRKDRMSMYNGLEVRVPFCDYRIAEYMYGVPWEYKDYNRYEKGLLRYAMRGLLPDEVLWRKKSPYPKTHDPQYMQLVSKMLSDVMSNDREPLFQVVSKKALQKLLLCENPWPWYGQLMRLPQTIAYMLQINFWLKHYNISLV